MERRIDGRSSRGLASGNTRRSVPETERRTRSDSAGVWGRAASIVVNVVFAPVWLILWVQTRLHESYFDGDLTGNTPPSKQGRDADLNAPTATSVVGQLGTLDEDTSNLTRELHPLLPPTEDPVIEATRAYRRKIREQSIERPPSSGGLDL